MLILRNPHLVAFEAVSRLGTMHAAAHELSVTQTAITQRIKALEKELSLTLFLRSRKGISLTSEGKALLLFCQSSRELEGQFFSQVKGDYRQEVELTLVGPTSAISTRVAHNVQSLYFKYPFLKLHLQSDDHTNIVDMIRRGEADLGVVHPSKVPNEMDSKLLKPDKYLLVASPKWKGRKLVEILNNERIIDFYESDLTTKNYLNEFDLLKEVKRERLFINENEALIHMFMAGVGYGTLTESVASSYINDESLIVLNKAQAMEDPLALVWYPRPSKMNYFDDLIRSIK